MLISGHEVILRGVVAKVFTQEEREKIKGQVVELVRQSGRETLRQLEAKTGATRYLMSVLARELVASGDVYNSGYGLFPSEQARKDWQNARKKLSRAKVKKPAVVDPDLIWSLYVKSRRFMCWFSNARWLLWL